jgi:hypothetical protein
MPAGVHSSREYQSLSCTLADDYQNYTDGMGDERLRVSYRDNGITPGMADHARIAADPDDATLKCLEIDANNQDIWGIQGDQFNTDFIAVECEIRITMGDGGDTATSNPTNSFPTNAFNLLRFNGMDDSAGQVGFIKAGGTPNNQMTLIGNAAGGSADRFLGSTLQNFPNHLRLDVWTRIRFILRGPPVDGQEGILDLWIMDDDGTWTLATRFPDDDDSHNGSDPGFSIRKALMKFPVLTARRGSNGVGTIRYRKVAFLGKRPDEIYDGTYAADGTPNTFTFDEDGWAAGTWSFPDNDTWFRPLAAKMGVSTADRVNPGKASCRFSWIYDAGIYGRATSITGDDDRPRVAFQYSTDPTFNTFTQTSSVVVDDTDLEAMATRRVEGLDPETYYYVRPVYKVNSSQSEWTVVAETSRVRTAAALGATRSTPFKFVFGGCTNTLAWDGAFRSITESNTLDDTDLFIHLDDPGYHDNLDSTDRVVLSAIGDFPTRAAELASYLRTYQAKWDWREVSRTTQFILHAGDHNQNSSGGDEGTAMLDNLESASGDATDFRDVVRGGAWTLWDPYAPPNASNIPVAEGIVPAGGPNLPPERPTHYQMVTYYDFDDTRYTVPTDGYTNNDWRSWFSVNGGVLTIFLDDTRFRMYDETAPNFTGDQIFDPAQRAWFKDVVSKIPHKLLVWVSSTPKIGYKWDDKVGSSWGVRQGIGDNEYSAPVFADEIKELVDYWLANTPSSTVMVQVAGDAHIASVHPAWYTGNQPNRVLCEIVTSDLGTGSRASGNFTAADESTANDAGVVAGPFLIAPSEWEAGKALYDSEGEPGADSTLAHWKVWRFIEHEIKLGVPSTANPTSTTNQLLSLDDNASFVIPYYTFHGQTQGTTGGTATHWGVIKFDESANTTTVELWGDGESTGGTATQFFTRSFESPGGGWRTRNFRARAGGVR